MLHNVRFKKVSGLIAAAVLSAFLANCASANSNANEKKLSDATVKSINMGIKSDISGVKKHAIEFAGLYLVDQSASTLISQFKVENDPEVRILILKALYLINHDEYMDAIKDLAHNDNDENVREYAQKLYPVIQAENN